MAEPLETNSAFEPEEEQKISPFDIPLEPQADTEQLRNNMAVYDSIVQLSEKGTNAAETYGNAMLQESAAIRQKLILEAQQRAKEGMQGAINQILDDPETSAEDLTIVPEVNEEIATNAQKPWAAQLAVVDSLENYQNIKDPELKEKIALNMWFYDEHLAGLYDKLGLNFNTFSDVTGLLLLSDQSLDMSRVVGTFFGSAEGWNRYIQAFQTFDADTQASSFLFLKEAISEATDKNVLKTMIALSQLLNPDSALEVSVDHALDKAGVLAYVGAVGAKLASIKKIHSMVKVAQKMENDDIVVDTVTAAASSPEVAAAVGMDRMDVAATASPFKMEHLFEGAADGYAKQVKDQFDLVDAYLSETKVLQEGIGIEPAERLAVIAKTKKDLESKPDIDNIIVTGETDKSFTVSYDKILPGQKRDAAGRFTKGPNIEKITETKNYVVDDITGGFKASKLTAAATALKYGLSPNFLFKQDREKLVQAFTRSLFASDKLRTRFNTVLTDITKPIKNNKESIRKIDQVLLMGDEAGEVYSYDKLVNTGIDGERLTPTEYNVYARLRHVMDKAFYIKNKEVRDNLNAQGLKEVSFGGKATVSKTHPTIQGAMTSLRESKFKEAYVEDGLSGTEEVVSLDNAVLKTYYDNGYVLTRSADNDFYNTGKDAFTKFMLVKPDAIKDLPKLVLNQHVGYIPRDYKEGIYFVKSKQRGIVEGVSTVIGLKTERYFNNITDANKFANDLKIGKDDPSDIRVLHDRQIVQEEFDKEVVGISGGLYTSPRKSEELLMGFDGEKGPRVDAMESISRYFTTMARNIPMTEYRLGITRRWLNSAKEAGAIPHNYSGTFTNAVDNLSKDLPPTQRAFLKKSHEQIQFQLNVPTLDEREMANTMRSAAEWMEDKKWFGAKTKDVAKAMHKFDHENPISAAKSATFHAFLGMGSITQFLIQGLGATVAMSIDPINAAKGMKKALALGYLDNIHNPNALKANKSRVASEISDIDELHELWRRTGFYESVVTSHGDLDTMAKGFHIGKRQVRNLFDKGLFFFKAGELANRRVSFATAHEWWRAQKGNATKTIGDNELKEIMSRSNLYLLNMSKGNKAGFQKGLMSVPTQFMQVHSKFLELVTGDQITTAEKFKLLGMQATIFGAAGVPFAELITDEVLEASGAEPGDLSEEQKDLIKGGILTTTMQNYLGVDVTIAGRTAIASGLDDMFLGFWESKEPTWKIALGAFGGLSERAGKAAYDMYNLGSIQFNGGGELSPALWKSAVDSTLDITSSWSNASLAYEVYNTKLLKDNKGQVVASLHGEDLSTILAMGAGLRHASLEDIYTARVVDMNKKERLNDKANSFMRIMTKVYNNADDDQVYQVADIVWSSMLGSETHQDQQALYRTISARLLNPTTKEEKIIKSKLTQFFNGQLNKEDILGPYTPELEEVQ